MGDHEPLQQHLLNFAQAQINASVKPHRMRDDLRRKSMTFVADGW